MEKTLQNKLLAYLVISALSFLYLVTPYKAALSIPLFIIVQAVCLYFITPKKLPLLVFVPIFILGLNYFISASHIWYISNIFVILVLYAVMMLLMHDKFSFKDTSLGFILDIANKIGAPLYFFKLPAKWIMENNKEQAALFKRISIGVVIALPCLIILVVVLSSADEIFSKGVTGFITYLKSALNVWLIAKIIISVAAGFYLFGLICSTYHSPKKTNINFDAKNADALIVNIVLFSILAVYTIFAVIQFRYLFASGTALPYGLTYTNYARRGFFELLFLSGINICIILATVRFTREQAGAGGRIIKMLCCYLCLITFVLLISSYYRMWLYNDGMGLTRLRYLVFGFLYFEAVGLVFTFFYILKPKFNIIAVYLVLGLIYYLWLNVVPMDATIAKDQIDRYFAAKKSDIEYTLSLSNDAAGQIARLLESPDANVRKAAQKYFSWHNKVNKYSDLSPAWQRFNWSKARCQNIYEEITFRTYEKIQVETVEAPKALTMEIKPVPEERTEALPPAPPDEYVSNEDVEEIQLYVEQQKLKTDALNITASGKSNDFVLPADIKIYAVVAYNGKQLGWRIDDSGYEVRLMEVTVNAPGEQVALVFGTYQPTIWHISWTEDTEIVSVIASGYHAVRVTGLPPEVPVTTSSHEEGGPFESFYIRRNEHVVKADSVVRKLWGRGIDQSFEAVQNKAVVGQPLTANVAVQTMAEVRKEDFVNPGKPLTGKPGLDEAVRQGLIREASGDDLRQYLAERARLGGVPESIIAKGVVPMNAMRRAYMYVVLSSDFVLPEELFGANSAAFILPKGTPIPRGPKGHCEFLSYDQIPFQVTQAPYVPTECRFTGFTLPPDLIVYAAGGYSGSKLNMYIDDSGKKATLMQVTVNAPGEKVALMLGADEPAIWHVNWTEGTQIAAVLVSGYHAQRLSGVAHDVPVLNTSYGNGAGCPWFVISNKVDALVVLNGFAKQYFQKAINQVYYAKNGKVITGAPLHGDEILQSAENLDVERFARP